MGPIIKCALLNINLPHVLARASQEDDDRVRTRKRQSRLSKRGVFDFKLRSTRTSLAVTRLFETRDLHFRPEGVRDSQATFSQSLRTLMRRTYGYHCSICLNRLTVAGSECATVSAKQVSSKDYLHHHDVIHTHHLSFQTLLA